MRLYYGMELASKMVPMRFLGLIVATFGFLPVGVLPAATLEKLSMDDMIQKSTEIVSAKVTGTSSIVRGPVVYTRYRVSVSEQWKGATAKEMDVHVPGGRHGSFVQTFSGSPTLTEGTEYVLFLWTSRSGLTQVIGLSQGLFTLKRDGRGEITLARDASQEPMMDASGRLVEDTPVSMRLREVVDRIHRTLAGGSRR
ncbi:MAG: hypothetical protein JNL98_25550 [Bryobacterales bacterium]|nr:hypothetical protein [Bryobacterales bacterium]